jgi:hypothetical protein
MSWRRRHHQWPRCSKFGKISYPDEPTALTSIRDIARLHEDRGDRRDRIERRAYPCDHCGRWHLTSQEERALGDYTPWKNMNVRLLPPGAPGRPGPRI